MNIVIFSLAALLFGFSAYWWGSSSPERVEKREKLMRVRWVGVVFGVPALAWCVPHAGAVSPDFLTPFFWPLVISVPVAGYFVLDYIFARTAGGWAIILSYEIIHRSFELSLPGAAVFAVMGWILGIGGIWVSGIPCHFRDAVRLAARNRFFKWAMTVFFGIFAVLMLYGAIRVGIHG